MSVIKYLVPLTVELLRHNTQETTRGAFGGYSGEYSGEYSGVSEEQTAPQKYLLRTGTYRLR